MLTLVRRSDGRVRFLVCEDLEDADEDIAEYGDGSVILCTDGYSIYEDIEGKEGVDGPDRHPLRHLRHRRRPHKHLREPPQLPSPVAGEVQRRLETPSSEVSHFPCTETQLT